MVSKPQTRHYLLAVSPSSYDYVDLNLIKEAYPEPQRVLGQLWPSQRARVGGLRSCHAYWYDGMSNFSSVAGDSFRGILAECSVQSLSI